MTTVKTRRVPTQERSKKRYDAILDASAIIFGDVGFQVATMEQIAAKAETSIGSLYQFFPNKLSVFEALGTRWVERSRAAFELLFIEEGSKIPWNEMLDSLVDGFSFLHQTDPAFRAVLVNFQLYELYAEADSALQQFVVEQVVRKLVDVAPGLTTEKRHVVATMIVTTVAALLFLSQRTDSSMTQSLLAETKLMVRRYVEEYAK